MEPGRFWQCEFILADDQRSGKNFRFAPEPNGPLHIGHVKTLRTNFLCAQKNGGQMFLRFDDTNPDTTSWSYCEAAKEVIQWLGYDLHSMKTTFTSDYFDQLLNYARGLIKEGHAYVCHNRGVKQNAPAMGSEDSPWRDKPMEENVLEFEKMVDGVYEKGEAVLRLKYVDLFFKDPVAYRIKKIPHFRTGDKFKVYPTYDFSHPVVDSLQDIAVSICTVEFAHHRSLYTWMQERLGLPLVPQREQPRLAVEKTVLSKRSLISLVGKCLDDLDDPRLATLAGLRSRGIPPKAIDDFVSVGMRDFNQLLDITRRELQPISKPHRVVLDPLFCHVTNYTEGDWKSSESPQIKPYFMINRFDFSCDETDISDGILSKNKNAALFGLPYMITVKGINRREDGTISCLQVQLSRIEKRIVGIKSLVWLDNPVNVTLAYINHNFCVSGKEPSPLQFAKAFAEESLLSSLKIGDDFCYGQTFRAINIGYITLTLKSNKDDIEFNITCFLKQKTKYLESILKCFTEKSK